VLVVWRLALRTLRGVPAAPEGENPLLERAATLGHWGLYALMIALPVTGLLAWYGGFASLAGLHGGILKALLWLLIIGHVGAALYHHFILKDGLLNRMRKAG
jgi:cytochrome b561